MRSTLELDVQHEGNLGGNRRAFAIDVNNPESLAHIMGELTDLYSDLVMAAVREPCTNAQDSHIASGQTRPIEVTLPTDLDASFTVRDWGVGMSEEELLEKASLYGWSSKRENDDEAGMLGFGFKAPLTYTSQFIVVGYKDGMKVDMLVSRGDDGVGGIECVARRKTQEPDGVEVIVPVKENREQFISKCMHFFGFWSPGSVLVNGEEPPKHMENDDARTLDPDVAMHPGIGQDWVVMGNVPYPVGQRLTGHNLRGNAIVRVPVGAVIPAPSREALRMVPRTTEALDLATSFVKDSMTRIAQADVDSCESPTESVRSAVKWKAVHQGISLTYRGKKFPSSISLSNWGFTYSPWHDTGGKMDDHSNVFLERAMDVVWVLNYMNKTFNKTHKAKLAKYLTDNGVDTHGLKLYLGEKLPDKFWLSEVQVIDWEEVHKVKVPPVDGAERKRERKPVGWEVMEPGSSNATTIHDPEFKGKIVVVSGQGMYQDARTARNAFPDETTVLLLHPNRVDKFARENKGAILLENAVKLERQRFVNRLTILEAEILSVDRRVRRSVEHLRAEDVLDVRLARFLSALRDVEEKKLGRRWQALTMLRVGYWHRRDPSITTNHREALYIEKMYPLLEHLEYYSAARVSDHIADYVNALYRTRQEKKA